MNKSTIAILLLFLFLSPLQAAQTGDGFTAAITFGDKTSTFKVWKDNTKNHFSFVSSDSVKREGSLSEKNFRFLTKKILGLKDEVSNKPDLCPRSFIVLNYNFEGSTSKQFGCIGSKTAIAKGLTELANTLDLLL
jgi:hypothetical protein